MPYNDNNGLRLGLSDLESNSYVVFESPVSEFDGLTVSALFSQFIREIKTDRNLRERYGDLVHQWNGNSENRAHYGGFFKNYFRNREELSGYDDKVVWQASDDFLMEFEFYCGMWGYRSTFLSDFLTGVIDILEQGVRVLKPAIHDLCHRHPELAPKLLSTDRELPCTIRLMRYLPGTRMGTNPHVDKTALTAIMWNSDPKTDQRLAFPVEPGTPYKIGDFRPAPARCLWRSKPAYAFWGAALPEAGYTRYQPTPHAVMPVDGSGYRYSIAVFWHLPGVDLTHFSTKVPVSDDLSDTQVAA